MSHNLYLKASREVFTKSGKSAIQTQNVSLWQTPTSVTENILSYLTFEEQLQAYCEWAESLEVPVKPENWIELEIYDTEIRSEDCYRNFDLENQQLDLEVVEQYEIVQIALAGTPEFEATYNDGRDRSQAFPQHSVEQKHLGVGYRWIAPKPHHRFLQAQVERLKADEYELEFYSL